MRSHRRASTLETRPVFVTALVTAMAAGLVGCSSDGNNAWWSKQASGSYDERAMAARATVTIDPALTEGQYPDQYFIEQSGQVGLPARWSSEAAASNARNRAIRAEAQVTQLAADSYEAQTLSSLDADLTQAFATEEQARANADMVQEQLTARLVEMSETASAKELAYAAEAERRDNILAAHMLDWQSQVDTMNAQALTEWTQSKATHEKMLAQRDAVREGGEAQVQEMVKIADLTSSRVASNVSAIRAESESIHEQTGAKVGEIAQLISTTAEKTRAEADKLRQEATSLERSSEATVAELRAKAKSLEEQDVDSLFALDVKAADAGFENAQAEAEQLFQQADALERSMHAEYQRRQVEADKGLEMDKTAFDEAMIAIDSFVDQGKATIAMQRVEAIRLEKAARAGFVRAESKAMADAVREQSTHEHVLAEEQFKRLKSEAEAEAARIQSEFASLVAKQVKAGSPTIPYLPGDHVGESEVTKPQFVQINAKPAAIEPSHVASYKISLAKAEKLRRQADAAEKKLFADAEERATKFETWWTEQEARHEASIAAADAFYQSREAEIRAVVAKAESRLKKGTAELDRAKTTADAVRRESVASIASLRAEADAIEKKAAARVNELSARADAVERNGQSEIRSLEVIRDATMQRGKAKVAKLNAEADAMKKSQSAVVAQMREEIKAAERCLTSELDRLDQAADSFIAIAEASYQETLAVAEGFGRMTEAATLAIRAENEAEKKIAQADVEFLRDVTSANQLAAEAHVSRLLANAEADLQQYEANDMIRRAQVIAENQSAHAAANARLRIADSQDHVTRARFDSRIVLTEAERNRAYANQYLSTAQKQARVQQAMAAADAYRDMSDQAMAKLSDQSRSFEMTAKQNWYSRLAIPASFNDSRNAVPTHVAGTDGFPFDKVRRHHPDQLHYFNFDSVTPGGTTDIADVPVSAD